MSRTTVNVIILVIGVGLAVCGQLALKAGVSKIGRITKEDLKHPGALIMRFFKSPWAVAGVLFYVLFALFWLVVLSRVSLSVAYPMIAGGFVVIVLYSRFVFHENVRPIVWIGLAFIVAGVILTGQGLKVGGSTNAELKPNMAAHVAVLSDSDASKKE